MLIILAWFTESGVPYDARSRGLHDRLERFLAPRVPTEWRRLLIEGPGWGMFATAVAPGGWNWDLLTRDDQMLMATVGLPVGLEPDLLRSGTAALGRAVLDGQPLLSGVVPPFGVVACDGTRLAVRQDWLGMASLYRYRTRGVVAFSNRAPLLPYAFGDEVRPDPVGWAHYAAYDGFSGPVSPVMGVEPLGPGQAVCGERNRHGRWELATRYRTSLDDVAAEAVAYTGKSEAELEAITLAGFTRVTRSLSVLWPQQLRAGLSGGRDSRVLAASLIANGLQPDFYTNTENPLEGETAQLLVERARAARSTQIGHTLVPPRPSGGEGVTGVGQRLRDLFLRYDFTGRRQSVLRGSGQPPLRLPAPTVNGGLGEIARNVIIPDNWQEPAGNPVGELLQAASRRLASKAGGPLVEPAAAWLDRYMAGLVERAAALKLDQAQSLAWMYCAARAPVWVTARHSFHQVLMYGTPEFITAAIALPLALRRESSFHRGLTERLMPEWVGVDYVKGGLPAAEAAHIWDGDGIDVLTELVESSTSQITWMLDRTTVLAALAGLRSGELPSRRLTAANWLLTTFAVMAAAEREFGSLNADRRVT